MAHPIIHGVSTLLPPHRLCGVAVPVILFFKKPPQNLFDQKESQIYRYVEEGGSVKDQDQNAKHLALMRRDQMRVECRRERGGDSDTKFESMYISQ